jgi:Na+-translocating ferredoxin:NAD+ oxidoreductase RnfD subunit
VEGSAHFEIGIEVILSTGGGMSPALPGRKAWNIPRRSDPRWVFAGLLACYAAAGCTVLGFNRAPLQILLTVAACAGLDMLFARVLRGERLFPLSAFITGLGLSLLVNYPHDLLLLFLPVFFAVASKYVLTCGGRHAFNPGLIGVLAAITLGGGRFATSPPYQWGEHPQIAAVFLALAAVAGFATRIRRGPLIVSFLVSFAALTGLRAWLMRWHLPPLTLLEGMLVSPAFFLFAFYMITDPMTSPQGRGAQIAWGFAVAAIDMALHFRSSLATMFQALFLVSAARWVWWHRMNLWRTGFKSLLPPSQWLRSTAVLTATGAAGALLYSKVLHPAVLAPRPYFVLEPVPAFPAEMSDLLTKVDPRIAHIAKWPLSVGDAVAVGDYDGDGRQDVFLTYPLKRPQDRNALYRNLGGLKFTRVPLPALDEISQHPEQHGIVSGALFVDYDNSGRQSLFLTAGWGKVRLLRNEYGADGQPVFRDVTAEAGLDEYTVSVAATFADFDLDGDLDLFIGNAMTPELPDYNPPQRFNIFALPQPQYEGDRRMFHFMHSTWHNAENGGRNVFLRQTAPGKFERCDIAALGMPETHWTMAVGTADLNQDGWPDLYCANDYGPDDLYLNEEGRRFRRMKGRFTGSIGRDTYKGMNVSVGDLDNRGWQDVHVSNVHAPLQAEGSLVWRVESAKDGISLRDTASERRLVNEQRFGWGAALGDLNLDGWLDLVQANGMVDDTADRLFDKPRDYWYRAAQVMRSGPEIHSYADRWSDLRGHEIWGRQQNRVCLSNGRAPAQFVEVADTVGLTAKTNTRAAALADFDDDGDADLILTHQFAPAELRRNTRMENTAAPRVHWLALQLTGDGVKVNRDAVGAQVFVNSSRLRQMREVSLTSGFSAQSDRRLHFGLGEEAGPVDVEVRWPGGGVQRVNGLPVDRLHRITFQPPPPSALSRNP